MQFDFLFNLNSAAKVVMSRRGVVWTLWALEVVGPTSGGGGTIAFLPSQMLRTWTPAITDHAVTPRRAAASFCTNDNRLNRAVSKTSTLKRDAGSAGTQTEARVSDDEDGDRVALADLPDTITNEVSKVLVLLDFNGLLVCKDKVLGGTCSFRHTPDFVVNYNTFFIRPFARELVCHLLNDPRCEVSQKYVNVSCEYIFHACHDS